MQVGAYADGRPLSFDPATSMYDIGGIPITAAQLWEYHAHNQIAWLPGYGLTAAAPLPQVPPSKDTPLSSTEWALYSVVFFLIPFVNVWVSSILYYVWRGERPTRAKQINRLGFIIFGSQILLSCALSACSASLSS
ncbi:hypothetical protein FDZ74_00080 [bacterium]|nr:MAG: hypothetical protein FDZ74_00080 [bacterium]